MRLWFRNLRYSVLAAAIQVCTAISSAVLHRRRPTLLQSEKQRGRSYIRSFIVLQSISGATPLLANTSQIVCMYVCNVHLVNGGAILRLIDHKLSEACGRSCLVIHMSRPARCTACPRHAPTAQIRTLACTGWRRLVYRITLNMTP